MYVIFSGASDLDVSVGFFCYMAGRKDTHGQSVEKASHISGSQCVVHVFDACA